MTVHMPEAQDLTYQPTPVREMRVSNILLDDHEAMVEEYEKYGYLLFRSVLDENVIAEARKRVIKVLASHGVVDPDSDEPIWNGAPLVNLHEESGEFSGIIESVFKSKQNNSVVENILGEPVSLIPIALYRVYAPNKPAGGVHQDGFYTPGVEGFRPIWVPLMEIDRITGGLCIAEGCNKQGILHNMARPPFYPLPVGIIPDDAWVTTNYRPGDLLIVHPHTPHAGMKNRSNKYRISVDTRVQSAQNPAVVVGAAVELTTTSVTLALDDGSRMSMSIDGETFIRTTRGSARRITPEKMIETVPIGMRIIVARKGNSAMMIRRAAQG